MFAGHSTSQANRRLEPQPTVQAKLVPKETVSYYIASFQKRKHRKVHNTKCWFEEKTPLVKHLHSLFGPLTSYRSSLSFQLHSFTQPSVGSVSFNSQLHSFPREPLVSHSLRQAKLVPGNHSLLCKSTSLLLGCMGKTSKACTWWSFLINLWFIFTHRKIVQSTKGQLTTTNDWDNN